MTSRTLSLAAALGALFAVEGCASTDGGAYARAGEAPRAAAEQRTDRASPSTSSDISHGNGRGGEHRHARGR